MLRKFLSLWGSKSESDGADSESRRRYARYLAFHAEAVVGERVYHVRDWGMGGVCFDSAPDARLAAGDRIPVVLQFRFMHETIIVPLQALVVRTAKRGIAVKFADLPTVGRRQLERVLDNLHAQDFLESQLA